jgi:aryl-alcohol dehydrogenase-like predicted oxidoreductase
LKVRSRNRSPPPRNCSSRGLIRDLGISHATASQIEEARRIADVVYVQNHYNLYHRADDALIDHLDERRIAYVPHLPLGRFSPLQSTMLSQIGAELDATPMQVAPAWLLQLSPNILLIPPHLLNCKCVGARQRELNVRGGRQLARI